jgi:hypothetical protein
MLVDFAAVYGGLSKGDLASRLVCFTADGVTIFQSLKTGVTV